MMSKAWIKAQIEHELERGNHPEAVRDLAALVTVHKYLCGHDGDDVRQYMHDHDRMIAHPRQTDFQKNDPKEALNRDTVMRWVEGMEDDDGVHGGKYSWHQTQQYALNVGVSGQDKMLGFYWAMNAMYADYHKVAKKFGVDKPDFYACMAKAFIDDPDAVENKVEMYNKYIVRK